MKKNFLAAFAVIVAIAFSAFTAPDAANEWFVFQGDPDVESSVLTPDNYVSIGATAPSSPGANADMQAIKVDNATELHSTGKPIVDVTTSQLYADVRNACGFDGSAVNEIANRVLLKPE